MPGLSPDAGARSLTPLSGLILLVVGWIFKSAAVQKAAFGIFIFAGIASVVSILSGKEAAQMAVKISGIDKNDIHTHAEWAQKLAISNILIALLAMAAWWTQHRNKIFGALRWVILLLCFVNTFFSMKTGTSGGEIRHTEIRSDNGVRLRAPASGDRPGTEQNPEGTGEYD